MGKGNSRLTGMESSGSSAMGCGGNAAALGGIAESGGVAAALHREIDLGTFPSASWKAKELEEILRPLGIESEAMFNPPMALRPRIAATEWGQRWEAKLGNIAAPRDGLIWGETHDGNSHFAGGTAGNAGLFATARAVFRL